MNQGEHKNKNKEHKKKKENRGENSQGRMGDESGEITGEGKDAMAHEHDMTE